MSFLPLDDRKSVTNVIVEIDYADRLRIAWLFPSLEMGNYWHPVFKELTQFYRQLKVYTGVWTGYASGYENCFPVEVVGKMKFVDTTKTKAGSKAKYGRGFIAVSPEIIKPLLHDKPDVIFTSGFSFWTLLALLLKPIGGWRLVVMYDGSSPTVDYLDAPRRLFVRRLMIRAIDAFITNSAAGKKYLTDILHAEEQTVFAQPYQVPDAKALLKRAAIEPRSLEESSENRLQLEPSSLAVPTFLYVGQLIPRKGVQPLLEACQQLKQQGQSYQLLVIGEGEQRQALEQYCQANDLTEVHWLGQVNYGELGAYFQQADVFILPTLEDIWGMVILEAMALGKPVLCSQWAGVAELIQAGENGYLFDPQQPAAIAQVMHQFIEHPEQIEPMGARSLEIISQYTPQTAAQFLAEVISQVSEHKVNEREAAIVPPIAPNH
jgi:glycosyltransferase involved in cell wall biosynthesis